MPGIPSTNIKMDDIATELHLGTGSWGDNSLKSDLFASSINPYNSTAGSYHNYNNMAISGTSSFATAIYTPYNSTNNMKLANWAGYSHDSNVILNIIINNACTFSDVLFDLYISDAPGNYQTSIFNGIVPRANSGNVSLIDYDTGVAAYTYFGSVSQAYWIEAMMIRAMSPNGTPINLNMAGSDTDNVGGGTARTVNATNPWDLDPGGNGDFGMSVLIAGNNGSGYPTDGISWNKRTIITLNVT